MANIDAAFWHDKWETGVIGFHQHEYHPALVKHWPQFKSSKIVFVPLCGKTKDMLYLRQHGHEVLGIELSNTAIEDFASENKLQLVKTTNAKFSLYRGENYDLRVGDYFDLDKDAFINVSAVYDRAALIALPPDLRLQYVAHMQTLLSRGTEILLITITYDQSKINPPPFSIAETEVNALFDHWCEVEKLEHTAPEDFRGIKAHETVFRLTVK